MILVTSNLVRVASLTVSCALLLAAASCSLEAEPVADSAGGLGGTGAGMGGLGSGGAGTGGSGTGGTTAGSAGSGNGGNGGGAGTGGGGGNMAGVGGGSGGVSAGTGGLATGGASAGSSGAGAGGMGAGAGGLANGGSSGGGTGGASAGAAGLGQGGSAGGGNAGSGGGDSGPVFHIFMLMGQSNMAGVAVREDGDMNSDERLKVLGGCGQPAGQWNTANPPLSDCPGEKGWNLSNTVDPGIWFGKTLLERLPEGHTIGLVGTAESGESINTFISGGSHHQMILNKIATAKTAPNARFSGVIFHQGESDSGQSSWPGKVVQLYDEVKEAFGVDYDVPFILGELPAGGCCSGHNNLVHQAADMLPMGDWVSQQGTQVMDAYHFDHDSVVLMGTRYGEAMIEALGW